jgi:hypothetical protein
VPAKATDGSRTSTTWKRSAAGVTITDSAGGTRCPDRSERAKDEVARLTSLLQIQALRADRGLPTIGTQSPTSGINRTF